jgi:hypothetical protein
MPLLGAFCDAINFAGKLYLHAKAIHCLAGRQANRQDSQLNKV